MAWKKYAKRVVRKVGGAIKRRYYKKGNVNVKRIAKDVRFLKSVLNPEKKRIVINNTSNTPVGQVNGNTSGHLILDLTPLPVVGTGYQQRNGASIRLHSAYYQFQLYDQTATSSPVRVKFMLFSVKGTPQSTSTIPSQLLTPTPFITGGTVYDYNSAYNPDFLKQYKMIKCWSRTMQPDQLSGQRIIKDVTVPLKFRNTHIRFNADSTVIASGQLILMILLDNGNMSASTASTLTNVPQTAVNTGLSVNYNLMYYYYDN